MLFQAYVIIIAVVLMFFLVYLIKRTMAKQAVNAVWPVNIPNCPDYWIDYSGDGSKCGDIGFNTTSNCVGTMDFSGTYCQKRGKAIVGCSGIIWDGVTYGHGNNVQKYKCK